MKKIQVALKKELNHYPKIKIYEKKQMKYFNLVAFFLLMVGLFVEYGYYSTIGHLGTEIAYEILKIHFTKLILISGFAAVLDILLVFLSHHRPKSIKQLINQLFERPALLFCMILMLMLSLDAPVSAFCIAAIIMTIMAQLTKKESNPFPLHPIFIGYFAAVIGTYSVNYNFGIYQTPPMFMAPFMTSVQGVSLLSYEDFTLSYYSLQTVIAGLFEGSLAGTLIIPLLVSGAYLIKRRCLDIRISGLYVFIYTLISFIFGVLFKLESWMIVLFLLNGSVLINAIFILPETKSLPRNKMVLYCYISALAASTVLLSYYVHFIFGPYLTLGIFQVFLGLARSIQKLIQLKQVKREGGPTRHSKVAI